MNSQNIQVETGSGHLPYEIALLPPANYQLVIHSVTLTNNSGGASDVGFGISQSLSHLRLYSIAGGVTTDLTDDLGSTPTLLTTTNNDGFIVQGKNKFNGILLESATNESGSPVYVFSFWNGATWETFTPISRDFTGGIGFTFQTPSRWVEGSDGTIADFDGLNDGYAIKVVATTAGGTALTVSEISALHDFKVFNRNLLADQYLSVQFPEGPLVLEAGQGIVPYFETFNAANTVTITYRVIQ